MQVKEQAGNEDAIRELVNIVRRSESNKGVLKAALGALAVLSSNEKNLKKMQAENLGELLERASKEKDERIVMFVSQLNERLHGQQ